MLEIKYYLNGSRPGRFRQGANAPWLPYRSLPVEANRAFSELIILLKALYLPGYCPQAGSITLLLKEPDYSYYGGFQPPTYRSMPPGASFRTLPAGSGTFMLLLLLVRAERGA